MKCRRNYKTKDDGRSIIFFGSKGRDELGHAIFSENIADHQYYLITCITTPIIPGISAENADFDMGYVASDNTVSYKFQEQGKEPELLQYNEIQDRLKQIYGKDEETGEPNKKIIPIGDVGALSQFFARYINRQNNYSSDGESVKDSLIQRLSVLKRELWYKRSYGLPLMDKIKNKGFIDIVVLDILSSHPSVINVVNFTSSLSPKRKYICSFDVVTKFASKEIKETLKVQL